MNKRTKLFIAVIACLAAALATTAIYANDYYRAVGVEEYMTDGEGVKITKTDEGYFFDGSGTDKALIFYPGAKVEETAYAELMRSLAEQGVDCFLIKMPMKLAFFKMNAADTIRMKYSYKSYYLAGHSLGGAMAADYSAKHPKDYSGLFLLAAYPTKNLRAAQFQTVFIYGENDKVLNREKLKSGYTLVPDNYKTVEIKGGNHAYFASYAEQKGDGKADITAEEQQKITVKIILETINN